MRVLLFLIFTYSLCFPIWADDDDSSEERRPGPIRRLVRNIGDIAGRMADYDGGFELSPEQSDLILVEHEMNELEEALGEDEECVEQEEEESERSIEIVLQASVSSGSIHEHIIDPQSGADWHYQRFNGDPAYKELSLQEQADLLNKWSSLSEHFYRLSVEGTAYDDPEAHKFWSASYYFSCIVNGTHPENNLETLRSTVDELYNALPAESQLSRDLIPLVLTNRIIQDNGSSEESINAYLGEAATQLNYDQKMDFLQLMGNRFLSRYDHDRAERSDERSLGVVTLVDMIAAQGEEGARSGVCRDIAIAQAQLAKALGIEHAYAVSFRTSTAHHMSFFAQNPDDPSQIETFNYDERITHQGHEGASALEQQTTMPSIGTTFRIFNSDAEQIAEMPTEMGAILRDMSGADWSRGNPLAERRGSIQQARIRDDNGEVLGNLFVGTLTNGDQIAGIARGFRTGSDDSMFEAHFGTGTSAVRRERRSFMIDPYGQLVLHRNNSVALQQNANIDANVRTPSLEVGPVRAQGSAGVSGDALLGVYLNRWNSEDVDANFIIDGALMLDQGGRIEVRPNDRLVLDAEVTNFITIGSEEVRDRRQFDLVHNTTVIESRVVGDINDRTSLYGDMAFVLRREFDPTAQFRTGVRTESGATAFVGYEGTLGSTENPYFIDGSRQEIQAGVSSLPIRDRVFIDLLIEKPLQQDGVDLSGQVRGEFGRRR